MLKPRDADALARLFRVLADPTRLRLVSALWERERCVHELVEALEMTQPAVSQQLRLLRHLEVERGRRQGRHVYYTLEDEHVRALYTTAVEHVRHARGRRGGER